MLNLDTYGGNARHSLRLPSLESVHANNLTQIQEVYQNLPQLNRAYILPPYDPGNNELPYDDYRLEQTRPFEGHPSNFGSGISPYKMNGFNRNIHQRKRPEGTNGNVNKRNGWGGETSYGHKHDSPALSALALLGFMFFLQLIQTSLQNNRQLLAANALAASTASTSNVAGRSNNNNVPRWRRDAFGPFQLGPIKNSHAMSGKRNVQDSTEMAVESPIQYAPFLQSPKPSSVSLRKSRRRISSKFMNESNMDSVGSREPQISSEMATDTTDSREDPVESFKSMSLHCFQLIACKIGRSILDNLDGTTGVVVRMIGTSLIPKIPQKTWTGRLMRAFNKGWNLSESCDASFKKCESLSRVLNYYASSTTSTVQSTRKF